MRVGLLLSLPLRGGVREEVHLGHGTTQGAHSGHLAPVAQRGLPWAQKRGPADQTGSEGTTIHLECPVRRQMWQANIVSKVLVFRTCEHICLTKQRDFADEIEVKDLEMGLRIQIIQGLQCNH
jgi:hypothetical protein